MAPFDLGGGVSSSAIAPNNSSTRPNASSVLADGRGCGRIASQPIVLSSVSGCRDEGVSLVMTRSACLRSKFVANTFLVDSCVRDGVWLRACPRMSSASHHLDRDAIFDRIDHDRAS